MNDQLTTLLEQLSEQLGTTTEYLWAVMITQAKTTVIINILYMLLTVGLAFLLFILNKRFSISDDGIYNKYDDNPLLYALPMIFGLVILVFLVLDTIISISTTITALFNPEYWALQQILDKL